MQLLTRLIATRLRRNLLRTGLALLAVSPVLVLTAAVGAAPSGAFTVTARADALSITVIDHSLPVVPGGRVFSSASTAQALFSSLGQSQAFAAAPNLDFVATLPPTVNGLLAGQFPPLPDYPLQVASSYPTDPDVVQEAGPYLLEGHTTSGGARAENRTGAATTQPSVLSVRTTAEAKETETDGLVATARSVTDPVVVNGVLTIGQLDSVATVEVEPDKEPVLTSRFDYNLLAIAGVPMKIDRNGLTLAGSVIPLDVRPLIDLLAGAGIKLTFLPEERTESSVTSSGLRVEYETDVPTQGLVTVAIELGRTTANVSTATPLRSGGGLAPVDETAFPSDVTPSPAGPIPDLGSPAARPVVPTPARQIGFLPRDPGTWADWRFYLAVVVAALLGLGGTRLVGVLAIRLNPDRIPSVIPGAPTLRLPPR